MTPAEYDDLSGADKLRRAVRALGGCRESFLDRFSWSELMTLHRMWVHSEWDISPDRWTEDQVQNALVGNVPQWTDDGEPA